MLASQLHLSILSKSRWLFLLSFLYLIELDGYTNAAGECSIDARFLSLTQIDEVRDMRLKSCTENLVANEGKTQPPPPPPPPQKKLAHSKHEP